MCYSSKSRFYFVIINIIFRELEKNGYKFNRDMLLIELYDIYVNKKSKEKGLEFQTLTKEDFIFLIIYDNGRFINTEYCSLEFYFLLLWEEYSLATLLLDQSYSKKLKDYLNNLFIGDETNLLKQVIMNPEIVKDTIKLALIRQLDGIALY